MRVCFLTGASGSLGAEVFKRLKKSGYKIITIGRHDNIKGCESIKCDFNNFNIDALHKDINELINNKKIETIDFVHCAGVYKKESGQVLENKEILEKTFNVNAFSFYNIVNILKGYWENDKVSGSVVAISSNLTKKKNKFTTSYISSKFALEGMVESFAETLGSLNVRFNTVSPGMFPSILNNFTVPESFKNNSPLGRICEVEDIVDTIEFLLSDKACCITAQNIVIDGGNSNGY